MVPCVPLVMIPEQRPGWNLSTAKYGPQTKTKVTKELNFFEDGYIVSLYTQKRNWSGDRNQLWSFTHLGIWEWERREASALRQDSTTCDSLNPLIEAKALKPGLSWLPRVLLAISVEWVLKYKRDFPPAFNTKIEVKGHHSRNVI